MYDIVFYEKAGKQLNKLPLNIQERITNSLERIRLRPFSFVKRKQGTPYYIFRVGYYRLILDIKKDKLIIFVIELGLRGNIYKNKQ